MTVGYCPICGEFIGMHKTHTCTIVPITMEKKSIQDLLVELLLELKETNRLLKIIEYTGKKQ